MKATLLLLLLVLLLTPGLRLGAETKTEIPKLEILSPAGAGRDVKVFNDDPAIFFARAKGDARGRLLNGLKFLLYKAGGTPGRPSDLIAESEDPDRWGRPPTSFSLPLAARALPVGKYRLRVVKPGHERAEIGVVQAEFGYFDLDTVHKKDRYRASLRFHLEDKSEKRAKITLKIRIESATGALIDRTERVLSPEPGHRGCFVTTAILNLSSRAKKPPEGRPSPPGRALRLVPGCRLVVSLDRTWFAWPVPLPSEKKRGSCGPTDDVDGDGGRGRGR